VVDGVDNERAPQVTPGRQLSGRETAFWYAFAAVTYCGAGVLEKGLLNWIIGPLWLVAVVWAGPEVVDRIRGRAR
jgi:hypothetical protein